MPQVIPGTRALPIAQKGFREGYKAILRPAVEQIGVVLNRYAGSDGKIDPKRERQVLAATGSVIDRVFVGYDGRHAYAEDEAAPLSPYAKLVNTWVAYVTVKAVRNQQAWMKRNVPEDVYNWLKSARRPENVREMISVAARLHPGFVPNAMAKYEPAHTWVDPNGYRLSDRVWRTDVDTRSRLDAMLAEQIRNGNSAVNISKMSTRFMMPGQADIRTNKPYGKDASYRGMVLGRTEITHAHGEATLISARLNPYVTGMDWVLSGSHPKNDPCDAVATVGPGGRIRDPYPVDSVPSYPMHPQCVLPGQLVTTIGGDIPIENVKAGDQVLTHEGRYQVVQSSWHNDYKGMIYRIETLNGSMEITPEHPVMTLRGWINAEDLQPTDYVLDTSFEIGTDCGLAIMENRPAQVFEPSITPSIFFGSMPVFPIAFDSDVVADQSEVQPKTFDSVLSNSLNPILPESDSHHLFNTSFPVIVEEALHGAEAASISITCLDLETFSAIETGDELGILLPHGMHNDMDEAGITDLLSSRNLSTNTGLSSRVRIPRLSFAEWANALSLCLSECPVVFDPLQPSCLTLGSQWDFTVGKEFNQHSELSSENSVDFRCAEHISDIELGQDILDRSALLDFDTLDMSTDGVESHTVAAAFTGAGLTANRTITGIVSTHDNLLSSSPECREGAASGNAVVGRVIRPSLAQGNYIKIQSISVREYAGLVYNMHVEVDNSYTVNGMAVHNCLCNLQSAVTATPAQVTEELRNWMQGDSGTDIGGFTQNEPPITPAADDTMLWMLLGSAFYQWWRSNQEAVAG